MHCLVGLTVESLDPAPKLKVIDFSSILYKNFAALSKSIRPASWRNGSASDSSFSGDS
jgi:hypothetical protein